jgi:hypothetical protein
MFFLGRGCRRNWMNQAFKPGNRYCPTKATTPRCGFANPTLSTRTTTDPARLPRSSPPASIRTRSSIRECPAAPRPRAVAARHLPGSTRRNPTFGHHTTISIPYRKKSLETRLPEREQTAPPRARLHNDGISRVSSTRHAGCRLSVP